MRVINNSRKTWTSYLLCFVAASLFSLPACGNSGSGGFLYGPKLGVVEWAHKVCEQAAKFDSDGASLMAGVSLVAPDAPRKVAAIIGQQGEQLDALADRMHKIGFPDVPDGRKVADAVRDYPKEGKSASKSIAADVSKIPSGPSFGQSMVLVISSSPLGSRSLRSSLDELDGGTVVEVALVSDRRCARFFSLEGPTAGRASPGGLPTATPLPRGIGR